MSPVENAFLVCLALAGVALLAFIIVAIVRANQRNAAADRQRFEDAQRNAEERERSRQRALEARTQSDGFSDRLAASRTAAAAIAPRPISLSKDEPRTGGLALPEPVPPSPSSSYRAPSYSGRARKKGRRSSRSGRRSGSSYGGYSSGADCSSGSSGASSCGGGGSSCGGGGGD
jgi:hypothetical protein